MPSAPCHQDAPASKEAPNTTPKLSETYCAMVDSAVAWPG
jgi:hypothetical protein